MRLGVLGPLVVAEREVSFVPRAPKQRQLLALMVMHANRVLPLETCVRELWDGAPPQTAVQTVQTYVMQLRRRAPALAARVVTTYSGYEFRAEPAELDTDRFAGLVEQATRATARDDHHAAAGVLAEALALWRGPALADVRVGPVLRASVVGLTESRLVALERKVEADLRLGRHQPLLDELRLLVEQHPQHENFWAQLMVALYRSGRLDEARRTYRRLCQVLADEEGLPPTPRIQRLYRAILERDPVLRGPGITSSGPR